MEYTTIEDGSDYVGEARKGVWHGKGEAIETFDGTIYEGDFVEGIMEGQGTFQAR